MKIGIIGSRRRDTSEDYQKVLNKFWEINDGNTILISGGCPKGGDKFAEIIAKEYHIPINIYYADWKKYGKSAGFIRNTYIAEDSDILIACVAKDRTGGTEDTIKKYLKLNKKELILV